MTDETNWQDLESLPEDGLYLVLDARDGSLWVSSHSGKPWRHNATHWTDLPSCEVVCANWKANYIRMYGELSYNEMMEGYKK